MVRAEISHFSGYRNGLVRMEQTGLKKHPPNSRASLAELEPRFNFPSDPPG